MRILLVEDNRGDVVLLQEAFTEIDKEAELVVMEDGVAALDHLRSASSDAFPDLIVLDLNLPKREGREILRDLKGDPKLKDIPVIVLTSSTAPADVEECYRLNAISCLVKRSSYDEVLELARLLLGFQAGTAYLKSRDNA